jgi:hypothetical protein
MQSNIDIVCGFYVLYLPGYEATINLERVKANNDGLLLFEAAIESFLTDSWVLPRRSRC